ncbi:hypothetical protein FNV43_RR05815 [Rhamnella rubrinervis]|uniref:Uncharacterized protein n=1 Tax=Rhamnella rubrinervis TaxID=2594499 RepID=A0A8K0HNB7_9ROSA|nr:hypothetical protein FNV43_RR05815 [Rhamnella rubrinervis]
MAIQGCGEGGVGGQPCMRALRRWGEGSSLITSIEDVLEKFSEDPDKPSRFKRRQWKKFKNSCFVLALHDGELNETATYSLNEFPQAFQEFHRLDTYENMPMNEEGEIRDEETNVM